MNTRTFLRAVMSCAIFLAAATPSLFAQNLPPAEKTKIETLISHVEALGDAKFVRNGKEYDAPSAAKFIRKKWQANEKEIQSASDFIAKAASVSATSGQPYLIRFKDGRELKCGDYLTARLKKL